jgi:hypothetical protein
MLDSNLLTGRDFIRLTLPPVDAFAAERCVRVHNTLAPSLRGPDFISWCGDWLL